MDKNIKIISGIIVTVLLGLGGLNLSWTFEKDWITLKRNDSNIAKIKWVIESERTYFSLNSWYDKNIKCPRVIKNGGYATAETCRYPPDYFEQLSRSLKNTDIIADNKTSTITKQVPAYKYGTNGAYAGKIIETMQFELYTESEENFPSNYEIEWKPKDTRNYKLVWRIENLKEINLPDGEYHDCSYWFGFVKIDLKNDCSKLDKAVIKDGSKIWFYFKPQRNDQKLNPVIVDPIQVINDSEKEASEKKNATQLCVNSTELRQNRTPIFKSVSLNKSCNILNVSESCMQYSNESYYKTIDITVFDSWNISYYNLTVCKEYGAVKYGNDVLYFENFYCKILGNYIVCNHCYYSTCQYGDKRCRSDDSQRCKEFEISTGKEILYRTMPFIAEPKPKLLPSIEIRK
jgi:hypothetical protein